MFNSELISGLWRVKYSVQPVFMLRKWSVCHGKSNHFFVLLVCASSASTSCLTLRGRSCSDSWCNFSPQFPIRSNDSFDSLTTSGLSPAAAPPPPLLSRGGDLYWNVRLLLCQIRTPMTGKVISVWKYLVTPPEATGKSHLNSHTF